ncbi:RNA polymerase sigma factor [Alkalicoccus luteus]|uniref:Sigma-70 family RNA polymerase sigma factor n=1 Tax=Alkalicoccus luteus TaxID=1237094 RepID=A0A969PV48_9BACI|nr:sigma-70 family RNA polymerase sigma factor [Alkalicoccus luteus]NJP38074.1 sigma-70 family RNA polymerase sigma factor [Alkalicoccus luteus]
MGNQEDAALYERLKKQDKQAMEELYDKYAKLLFSFAYKMVQDRSAAEEIVQEVMIKLWRGKGVYHTDKGRFSSWLLTITRNTAIDYIRKHTRAASEEVHTEAETVDEGPGVDDLVEWKQRRETIKEAMQKLKSEQRVIIELFYFKGYSHKRIADSAGIPLGTVKGRIRLALKHLKQELYEERGDWQ